MSMNISDKAILATVMTSVYFSKCRDIAMDIARDLVDRKEYRSKLDGWCEDGLDNGLRCMAQQAPGFYMRSSSDMEKLWNSFKAVILENEESIIFDVAILLSNEIFLLCVDAFRELRENALNGSLSISEVESKLGKFSLWMEEYVESDEHLEWLADIGIVSLDEIWDKELMENPMYARYMGSPNSDASPMTP